MTPINWPRVLLGALVWWVSYNVLTGAAWFAFLRRVGLSSFHPLLGASEPSAANVVSLLLLTLVMGVIAMSLYAIIRPRYAGRPVTPAYVGIALWLLWGLLPHWPYGETLSLPVGSLLAELASKLVVLVVATAAGASLYRERAVRSVSSTSS